MAKKDINSNDGKFIIKGKSVPNFDSDIEVDIGSSNASLHEVVSKTIPDPTPHDGGMITWFNAFGVKVKSTGKYADISYTVTLKAIPAGKKLFALYNDTINEIPFQDAGSGNIKFTLSVGDPPVGYGP